MSQQLIPCVKGGQVAAFEVMRVDPAIASVIREGKVHQLDNMIYAGSASGMQTMDGDILRLYNEGLITRENALMVFREPRRAVPEAALGTAVSRGRWPWA